MNDHERLELIRKIISDYGIRIYGKYPAYSALLNPLTIPCNDDKILLFDEMYKHINNIVMINSKTIIGSDEA